MTDEPDLSALSEAEIAELRVLLDRRKRGLFVDLEEGKKETLAMLERKRRARGL